MEADQAQPRTALLDRTAPLLALFLSVGLAVFFAALLTVYSGRLTVLANHSGAGVTNIVITHWLNEGFFHYFGLMVTSPPGQPLTIYAHSGTRLVTGFLLEKIYVAAFGHYSWRLIALPLGWTLLKPYQKDRIGTFLNPDRDPLGRGYQVTQAKIAIGSGGIHGKGFKQGTQAKLEFLPARHTDFIFAVLGEEWGFIGVTIVLGLYLFLILQALTFAKNARDRGGTFLAICLISFFIFHVLINVSMQIGLLPTTGIPLPLLSYGGSSVMMFFIAVGLMLNVDMRRFVNE